MCQVLTLVDTTGIQPYIFSSNRMRENIGGSYLVAVATRDWALEILYEQQGASNCNVCEGDSGQYVLDLSLSDASNREAEVVYAGGGNTLVRFTEKSASIRFVRGLTQRVLKRAPGLQLVVHMMDFDPCKPFRDQRDKLMRRLQEKKWAHRPSEPLLGVGPTVMCRWTGVPAAGVTPEIKTSVDPGSPEILIKCDAGRPKKGPADKRLGLYLPPNTNTEDVYVYPKDLDDLGGSRGESAYVAVVHADGNAMGALFKNCSSAEESRKLSETVNACSLAALRKTLDAVRRARHSISVRGRGTEGIKHPNDAIEPVEFALEMDDDRRPTGRLCLPIRPLVYGGDDVTFVCDGRLGIALAVEYLNRFAEETKEAKLNCGKGITACAGVAIVKTHYPFFQAYHLAESLARNAKKYHRMLKDEDEKGEKPASVLDWHIATSGLYGELSEMRRREYLVKDEEKEERWLNIRPVAFDSANAKSAGRTWDIFKAVISTFQSAEWQGKRNKMKDLRNVLHDGKEATAAFLVKYGIKALPRINVLEDGTQVSVDAEMGIIRDESEPPPLNIDRVYRNVYFDAIEAADFCMPLWENPDERS